MTPMIQTVHILGMGFRQSAAHVTGLELLWRKMRGLASPRTLVLPPQEWDADAAALAAFIARNVRADATIRGVFYSWGGGVLMPALARALQPHGHRLRSVLLVDAVFRSAFLPTWLPLNPLSLLRSPRISVPANIDTIEWFRQLHGALCGHDLKMESQTTIAQPCVWLRDTTHTTIDEATPVHDAAMRLAVAPP